LENIVFLSPRKKTGKTRAITELHRIQPASLWLADEKRQALATKMFSHIALDEGRKDSHCKALTTSFIEACQGLPETANRYYSEVGGLIDHALNRTEAALELFNQFLVKSGDNLSEDQLLWQYALFSAALLKGIGKLYLDYNIDAYDNNGYFQSNCNLLIQSLMTSGKYYYFTFEGEHDVTFRRRLNLLLARNLMPQAAFNWLANNRQVFAIWLALLNEDMAGSGGLGAILVRAEAIALSRYYDDMLDRINAQSGKKRMGTFIDAEPESLDNKEIQTGLAFIKWLQQSLESSQIMINKSPLFAVPGGMIMCAEMYKLFVREHPEYKNWMAVQKAFLSLGLHDDTHGDEAQSFMDKHTGKEVEGHVFSAYAMALPDKVACYEAKTQTITSQNLMDVVYQVAELDGLNTALKLNEGLMPALDAKGIWQEVKTEVSARLDTGLSQRG